MAACAGTNFKWDTVRQLRVGMTEAEVTALMGPPNNIRSGPEGVTWAWAYVDMAYSTRSVAVTFRDGRLNSVPQVPESFK